MDGEHPNDPLHGMTLEAILLALVDKYGWEGLAERIPVRCFESEPSLKSSLTFLRRTPWARAKVEALYLGKLRPRRPARRRPETGAEGRAPAGGGRKAKPEEGQAAKPAARPAAGSAAAPDSRKRRAPAAGPAAGTAAAPARGSERAPEAGPAGKSAPVAKPAARGRNRYPGLFEN